MLNVINSLLISKTNHYSWIKNMSRLISSELTKNAHQREYCLRCMWLFTNLTSLKDHLEICSKNEPVRMDMPVDKDGNPWKVSFTNYLKKMRVPFIVYADFECFTESISSCTPDGSRSYTEKYQKHKPSGFCFLIKSFDDSIFPPKLIKYTIESPDDDVDISEIFYKKLEMELKKIYENFLTLNKKMIMTAEDEITIYKSNPLSYL